MSERVSLFTMKFERTVLGTTILKYLMLLIIPPR
jgi:hypothetical protein